MSALIISLVIIILANLFPWFVKTLNISASLLLFTVIYSIIVVVGAIAATFLNAPDYSSGEILLIPIAIAGFIVRVVVSHFRRSAVINALHP
jgi:hypothetical protein